MKTKKKSSKNRKRQARRLMQGIFVLGILLVAVIVVLVLFIINGNKNKQTESSSSVIRTEAVITSSKAYTYNNAGDFEVDSRNNTAILYYENAGDAKEYLKYSITLDGVVIYQTPVLAPGEKVDTGVIRLPSTVGIGTTPVKIYIDKYANKDDKECLSEVVCPVNMIVK